jgi:hypothetical protein
MLKRFAMAGAVAALIAPAAMAQYKSCGTGGSCVEAHIEPGCDDASCCTTVCNFDSFCCDVEWDAACVDIATANCDFACSGSTEIFMGDNAIDTTASTADLDLSGLCDPGPYGDDILHNVVWYDFTATENGLHLFSTCNIANFDTRIAVLGSCDPGSVIACLDDSPGCATFTTELAVSLVAGETYKVAIGGYAAGDLGTGTLAVSAAAPELAAVRQFRVEDGGDGAWYGLYTVPGGLTFEDFEGFATDAGESLVSIHSQEENDCMQALRQASGAGAGIAMGLKQDTSVGEPDLGWGWTDGTDLDYTNWFEGEPNNGGGTENYGEIWRDGTWNDRSNTSGWVGYMVRLAGSDYGPVANDTCDGAIALSTKAGTPYSTTNAYGSTDLSDCYGSELIAHNDVFFTFTAKQDSLHVFKLCGSSFDSVMGVLDACDGSVLACNDDACGDDSTIALDMSAGDSVVIVVGGFSAGNAGNGEVVVEIPPAPSTTDSLSVNFIGGAIADGSDGGVCFDSAVFPAGADGYSTLYWQNLRGPNATEAQNYADAGNGDSPAALADGTGADTAAFVGYGVNNTWRVISFPSNDTERMRRGYLDSNAVGTIFVTVNDVPYDTYDVVVYLSCDGNDRPGSVTVNDAAPVYFLTEAANGPGTTFEPLNQATATTIEDAVRGSYVVVEGLTSPSCEIAVMGEGGGNVGVAGFQIVKGEGGGCFGDLNGDGQVNGADFGVLLASWGPCPGCDADLNGDGTVSGADVGLLLSVWGICP